MIANPATAGRRRLIAPKLARALALALACACVAAQENGAPASGRAPSRILLTPAGDPSRTMAVTWRMAALAGAPVAQIAPLTGDPDIEKQAQTVAGSSRTVQLPGVVTSSHCVVRFHDLKPGLKYSYRVGDGATWSEWNVFQTAAAGREPFRFLYLGDAQNDIYSRWSRAVRVAFATAPDARFIVHTGDLVSPGYSDRLWGEWCAGLGFIGAMVPSLPVPGNHDLVHGPGDKLGDDPLRAADPWFWHFALPMNGPEGLQGQSYYVDYQGVRVISLDVNTFIGAADPGTLKARMAEREIAWLDQVLRDNPARWTIVFQHQPVYPVAKERQADRMQAMLAPVFDRHHVDLVLAGHDHCYGRTFKVRVGKVSANGEGTVYVVSVSGPKMYELSPARPDLMAKVAANTQLFQIIAVDDERLECQSRSLDGTLVDSFELQKKWR